VRLLVVDQSLILQWLVRHEFPDGLEIASARNLDEAQRFLDALPPDAAVVSLPPAELPWRDFQHRCASHVPPIPVLYESCVDADAAAMGIDPADGYAAFLHKPASRDVLHEALEALFAASRCGGEAGSAAPELSATAPSLARRGS
jgi:DNA-binding NarL/FixJ family response regulator